MIVGVASFYFGLDHIFNAYYFARRRRKVFFIDFAIVFRTLAFHPLFIAEIGFIILTLLGELFLTVLVSLVEDMRFDHSDIIFDCGQLLDYLLLIVVFNII